MNNNTKIFLVFFVILAFVPIRAADNITDLLNKKNINKVGATIQQKAVEVNTVVVEKKKELLATPEGIPLVGDMSDADEQALGREMAGRLLSAAPLIKNDSLQHYINLVGVTVARQTPRASLVWTFGIISSSDINAFAVPGGYIFVTQGLYKMLQNEAELAAVLGHEIAHVNLRHHVRLLQKQLLIAKGKNMLIAQTKNDAVRELAGSGAVIWARSLDKNAEYESDCKGVEYAARAGYDPYGYIDLLDRMGADKQTDRLALLYKTHPGISDRITTLQKAMAAQWGRVSGIIPNRLMVLE